MKIAKCSAALGAMFLFAGAFGAFGTIEAGYNMQAGGAVFGLTANYDIGHI